MSKNHKQKNNSKKLQSNISVRWRQSTVIEFDIFLPSPTVICRLWVSVPELWRARKPACWRGKIKRLHSLSPNYWCPTCASQGLLQSQKVGDEQLNNFPKVSKWVITTPAQTLCGFKIVRTRRSVLIREAWECVLGPPEHMGGGFRFQSLWNKQPLWDRCTHWERKLKLKTK